MSRVILLDTNTLGLVTNPRATPANVACQQWLIAILLGGDSVRAPEIADYELRRELLRLNKYKSVARLDQWKAQGDYLPLSTDAMLLAAEFWAMARSQRRRISHWMGMLFWLGRQRSLAAQALPSSSPRPMFGISRALPMLGSGRVSSRHQADSNGMSPNLAA